MGKLFPGATVVLTKYFDVHQDWEVPIPGFFIVASRRNISSVDEFYDDEALEFVNLVRFLRRGMRDRLGVGDVYFFQREDSEHGFHLWVFPRYKWMNKFGEGVGSVRSIMNYAKENMINDDVKREVFDCVNKMKEYMRALI